jgi:hypothetical protein
MLEYMHWICQKVGHILSTQMFATRGKGALTLGVRDSSVESHASHLGLIPTYHEHFMIS